MDSVQPALNLRSDRPGWVASWAGASGLPRNGHLPLLCAGTRGLSPADATWQSRQPGGDHPRFPPSPGQRPSWPAGAVFPTLPLSPAHAPVQLVHAAPVYPHPAGQEPGAEVSPPDLCPPPAGLFLPQAAWALGCHVAAALPRLLQEPSSEGSVGGLGGRDLIQHPSPGVLRNRGPLAWPGVPSLGDQQADSWLPCPPVA